MNIEQNVDIAAPPAAVWAAWIDVPTWPIWSTSVTSAERLDDGPFAVGSRSHLVQPGLRPAVWTVTDLTEPATGRDGSFVWESSAPGIRTTASHVVTSTGPASCRVALRVEQDGPLAGLVGRMFGARTRRYVGIEAAGIRTVSEAHA